jgi:TPR repeat protein
MPFRTPLALSLLTLCLAAPHAANAASIIEARQAYYLGQYSRALTLFEQLAAGRDGDAAEAADCAAFMLLHGDRLYGAQVVRDVERARRLLLQAAHAGRPSAGFTLNLLESTD